MRKKYQVRIIGEIQLLLVFFKMKYIKQITFTERIQNTLLIRIELNNKQTRNDRKIENYFQKVCDSQNDIACEIIIELGDMDFWQDKDNEYRYKMTDVYNEQIQELSKLLSTFKVANATIHYDETSPHMHVIGVSVIDNCKRGMKNKLENHNYLLKPYFLKYKIK